MNPFTINKKYSVLTHFLIIIVLLSFSISLQIGFIYIPHPWVSTFVTLIVLFIFPGFLFNILIATANSEDHDILEVIAISFFLSVGLLLVPATILLLIHSTLSTLTISSVFIQILLSGIYLWRLKPITKSYRNVRIIRYFYPKNSNPFLFFIFIAFIILAITLFIATANVWRVGDRWWYLAYIQQYYDSPVLNSVDPYYGSNLDHPRQLLTGWLVVLAFFCRISGLNPVELYSFYFPPFLIITSILSCYALAKALFNDHNKAFFACIVQIVYYLSTILTEKLEGVPGGMQGSGDSFFWRLIEDKSLVWLLLLPTATMFMLRYIGENKRGYLVHFILGSVILAIIHPLAIVQYGLIFCSFGLIFFIVTPRRDVLFRITALMLPLLIFTLIPLWQLLKSRAMIGGIALDESITRQVSSFFLYSEAFRFARHPMIIISLLLTPLLLLFVRDKLAAQFLFSNMALPILIIFNPITMPFMLQVIGPLLPLRLLRVLPVALTLTFFMIYGIEKIQSWLARRRGDSPVSQLVSQLTPVVAILLVLILSTNSIKASIELLYDLSKDGLTFSEQEVLEYFSKNLNKPSTVLAEKSIGQYLPGYAPRAVILTEILSFVDANRWFCPGCNNDVQSFFSESTINIQHIDILTNRKISYIIIGADSMLDGQLDCYPDQFARVFQNNYFDVYRVLSVLQDNEVIIGNTYYLSRNWDDAINSFEKALDKNPKLPSAFLGLAKTYQAQKDFQQAEAFYQTAMDYDEKGCRIVAGASLAQMQASEGNSNEAIDLYQKLIDLRPKSRILHQALGDIYLSVDRKALAINEYEKSPLHASGTELYLTEFMEILRNKKLFEYAVAVNLNLVDRFPYKKIYYRQLAFNYLSSGHQNKAETAFKHILDINPYDAKVFDQLAKHIYLPAQNTVKAIDLYQQAIGKAPYEVKYRLALGSLYLEQALTDYR